MVRDKKPSDKRIFQHHKFKLLSQAMMNCVWRLCRNVIKNIIHEERRLMSNSPTHGLYGTAKINILIFYLNTDH